MPGRDHRLLPYQWYFISGVLITLVCGLLYPLTVYLTIPHASNFIWLHLLHNPNYTIFYIVFLPLVAGILAASISLIGLRLIHIGWFLFWVFVQFFVAVNASQDMLNKGPPLSPLQIQISDQNRSKLLQIDQDVRECTEFCRDALPSDMKDAMRSKSLGKNTPCSSLASLSGKLGATPVTVTTLGACQKFTEADPAELLNARNVYVTLAAKLLDKPRETMNKFSSFSDFAKRASGYAYVDTALTFIAGVIISTYFWYLLYLLLSRRVVPPHTKDRSAIILILLVAWIPLRIYAIWYANYYVLTGAILGAMFVVVAMAFLGLLLVVTIYKPGPVVHILSAIELVLGIVISGLAYIKSDWLISAGGMIDGMGLGPFMTIEAALFVTLIALAWSYLDPSKPAVTRRQSHKVKHQRKLPTR